MNQSQHTALVVIGMHRSGTSMLAGCLHRLGVNLGTSMMAPNPSNEFGYFENRDIVLIHDILLRDLGCRWDVLGNLPDDWLESEAADQAEKKLITLIEREFSADRLWAVKDPRICRLLPLWTRLLKRMEVEPVFAIMVRHPFEVAKSLEKRDQFDLMKGHLLWMVHYRDALNRCLEYPHVMITYDQLLADPFSTLNRISRVLNLNYPQDIDQHYSSIIDFIRPELKHHQISHDSGTGSGGIFAQYDWIYQQFRLAQTQAIEFHPLNEPDSDPMSKTSKTAGDSQLSVFPLVTSIRTPSGFKFEQNHATAMFNNLLTIIGRYERADISHTLRRERALLSNIRYGEELFVQVFFPTSSEGVKPHSEEKSQKILVAPNEWEKISIPIRQPEILRTRHLRFDPLNTRGIVFISAIKLLNGITGQILWSAETSDAFQTCTVRGDAFVLSTDKNLELVCTGSDPQLLLPKLPDLPDIPLTLEVWMKASRSLIALQDAWSKITHSDADKTTEISGLKTNISQYQKKEAGLQTQLKALTEEKQNQTAELNAKAADIQKQLETLQQEKESQGAEAKTREAGFQTQLKALSDEKENQTAELNAKAADLQKQLETLQQEKESQGAEAKTREAGLQTQLKALSDEKEYQTAELNAKAAALQKQLESLQQEKERLDAEVKTKEASVQNQLENILADNKTKDSRITGLESKLNFQEELTRQYYTELRNSERENIQKESERQKHVAEMNEKTLMLQKQLETLQQEKESQGAEAKTREAGLQNEVKALSEEKQKLILDISSRDKQILEFENKLKSQEKLTRQYFTELSKSEKLNLQQEMDARNQKESLEKQIEALKNNLDYLRSQQTRSEQNNQQKHHRQIYRYQNWIGQIENDYMAIRDSARWKTGNFVVRFLEILMFRKKQALVIDHLDQLFQEYHTGRNSDPESMMRKVANDMTDMFNSRRWKFGHCIISIVERLIFRGKTKLAADHVKGIIHEYRQITGDNLS